MLFCRGRRFDSGIRFSNFGVRGCQFAFLGRGQIVGAGLKFGRTDVCDFGFWCVWNWGFPPGTSAHLYPYGYPYGGYSWRRIIPIYLREQSIYCGWQSVRPQADFLVYIIISFHSFSVWFPYLFRMVRVSSYINIGRCEWFHNAEQKEKEIPNHPHLTPPAADRARSSQKTDTRVISRST